MTNDLKKAIELAESASDRLQKNDGGSTITEALQKSHVKQYARKDGTVVQEHDDSRVAKKKAVKEDIMRQIREKRKENAADNTGTSLQADSNRDKWDDLPDEENPKHSLWRISSKELGKIAQGKNDLQKKAKEELAARGVDEHGKWLGFDKAKEHHGVSTDHMRGDAPDHDEVMGHLQTVHHKVLGAIASGHLDGKRLAAEELANRGHDHDGNWIGFDKADKLHGVK